MGRTARSLFLLLLVGSGTVVLVALGFQYVDGLAPCELCLYERWPYYAALVVALAGIAGRGVGVRTAMGLAVLLFAGGTALAFYHVGVEQHWFTGPTACTGTVGGASTIEELKRQLLARQPVNCDEAAWRLVGISLAGWNLLASLGMLAFCLLGFRKLKGAR